MGINYNYTQNALDAWITIIIMDVWHWTSLVVLLSYAGLRSIPGFMIYTEPFVVTGGGPGNATTFLSIDLVKMAIGQFDLGPAAAFSLIYFLVILLVSWAFYTVMMNMDKEADV